MPATSNLSSGVMNSDSRPASVPDRDAVRGIIESYADRLRAGDPVAVAGLYARDAAVMAPHLPTTVGREQLTAVYRDALGAVAMDFRFDFDEIVIRGDTAVARTRTSGANTIRATGEVVPAHYRELFVLQRLEDGWKITQYMFQPMP